MADEAFLAKLSQARDEREGLEQRLEARAAREAKELATLSRRLAAAQDQHRDLEAEGLALARREPELRAEHQSLDLGLRGWRRYRARVLDPALQAGLLLGCFVVVVAGSTSGLLTASLQGLGTGTLLAAGVLAVRRWRPRRVR